MKKEILVFNGTYHNPTTSANSLPSPKHVNRQIHGTNPENKTGSNNRQDRDTKVHVCV